MEIHADLATGALTMGHARALLALGSDADQRAAAREAISRHLSVRDTEALVRRMGSESRSRPAAPASPADVHTRAAEDRLRFALGTKVRITRRGTGGTIEVAFTSEAELDRLYRQLTS